MRLRCRCPRASDLSGRRWAPRRGAAPTFVREHWQAPLRRQLAAARCREHSLLPACHLPTCRGMSGGQAAGGSGRGPSQLLWGGADGSNSRAQSANGGEGSGGGRGRAGGEDDAPARKKLIFLAAISSHQCTPIPGRTRRRMRALRSAWPGCLRDWIDTRRPFGFRILFLLHLWGRLGDCANAGGIAGVGKAPSSSQLSALKSGQQGRHRAAQRRRCLRRPLRGGVGGGGGSGRALGRMGRDGGEGGRTEEHERRGRARQSPVHPAAQCHVDAPVPLLVRAAAAGHPRPAPAPAEGPLCTSCSLVVKKAAPSCPRRAYVSQAQARLRPSRGAEAPRRGHAAAARPARGAAPRKAGARRPRRGSQVDACRVVGPGPPQPRARGARGRRAPWLPATRCGWAAPVGGTRPADPLFPSPRVPPALEAASLA